MKTKEADCVSHRKDTEQCMEDVEKLNHSMYGNGSKGVKERVAIIETNFAAVGESIKITGAILALVQFVTGMGIAIATAVFNSNRMH